MSRYAYEPKGKHAKASGSMVRISPLHSVVLCRKITGMNAVKAKVFLENLGSHKASLRGKFYDKTAQQIRYHLKQAESNAEFQVLDPNRLLVHASASKGFAFARPRRTSFRRRQIKSTNTGKKRPMRNSFPVPVKFILIFV